MLWLLWITQYYYLITDALQDTMEEWMKLLACSSHDYMKLMVYELQQKLAELDAIDVTSSRSCDFRENVSRYIHILKFWNCKTMINYPKAFKICSFRFASLVYLYSGDRIYAHKECEAPNSNTKTVIQNSTSHPDNLTKRAYNVESNG